MNKRLTILLSLILASAAVYASKARQAALLNHRESPQSSVESSLAVAIERRDDKGFAESLKKDQSEEQLSEALKAAAGVEDMKYLKAIIEKKKNAEEVLKKDSSIYLVALAEGGLANVKYLDSKINAQELKFQNDLNVLQQAIAVASAETISYIAQKNSKLVQAVDTNGESIVFLAVRRGDRGIVDQVLKLKNLPDVKTNKKGQSAKDLALELGYKRIAEKIK